MFAGTTAGPLRWAAAVLTCAVLGGSAADDDILGAGATFHFPIITLAILDRKVTIITGPLGCGNSTGLRIREPGAMSKVASDDPRQPRSAASRRPGGAAIPDKAPVAIRLAMPDGDVATCFAFLLT